MLPHTLFLSFLQKDPLLGYVLAGVGTAFEGDITLFTVAFLTHSGFFKLPIIAPLVVGSAIGGDCFWFAVGRRLSRWHNGLATKIEQKIRPLEKHFLGRTFPVMVLTKFTYGFHRPAVVALGNIKTSWKKFLLADIVAVLIWVAAIGSLGFLGSVSWPIVKQYLRYTEVVLLSGIIIFISLRHWLHHSVSKKYIR